jgi:two-component system, cell cycle sensor histidine kinase and response regulator CckA
LLTRQLLAFSRKQVLQPQTLNLNEVISKTKKMLKRLIGEHIDLTASLDPKLGYTKADPGQIEQVIMNLAVNARDAMPNGGKLTIETANVYLDKTYAQNHLEIIPGPYLMLAVSDNGIGMEPEIQARIFEPFFTTKCISKGTGLGLSTVYGIIKQSGGCIWVYSELNTGTTFKIYLPRLEEAIESAKIGVVASEPQCGCETILVVEDDDALRAVIARALVKFGYKVLEGRNGSEALMICEELAEPIHLMLTDVIMPNMSGSELSQRLTSLLPQTKVLFMSGYTDDAIVRLGMLDLHVNFIQKPFKVISLTQKVREVLDSPQSSRN